MADRDDWVKALAEQRAAANRKQLERDREAGAEASQYRSACEAFWREAKAEMLQLVSTYNGVADIITVADVQLPNSLALTGRGVRGGSRFHAGMDAESRKVIYRSIGATTLGARSNDTEFKLVVMNGRAMAEGLPPGPKDAAAELLRPWFEDISKG